MDADMRSVYRREVAFPGKRNTAMRADPLVYITMPFAPEFEEVRHVVQQVFESVGWRVARRDMDATSAPAMNAAFDMILQADLIFADLSRSHPTTMYELGVAHGLRKQTIITIHTGSSEGIPFDVSSYQVLTYSEPAELEKALHRIAHYTMRQWEATA